MEEEMRKIEEEFAFQEKWIKLFKRGKFILQNISEYLILKIITKMEAKTFFKFLRTGKWMLLLCEENRDSLLISFKISNYDENYMRKKPKVTKKERNQDIQQLRKVIQSKYYFLLCEAWYGNLMEDLYSKEVYHFRRECWNIEFLRINKFPINISIINHLQPVIIEISMNQNGPLPEDFNIPARTKSFTVRYASISDSDFYKEIERFGSLPLKATFSRKDGLLKPAKLVSTLKRITQKKHLHYPLQFLTYKTKSHLKYAIFDSWPTTVSFYSSVGSFYFIIVTKSDVGVSVIHLFAGGEREKLYTQIIGIKSSDEWEKFTKKEIVSRRHLLETCGNDNQLTGVLKVFSTQVASEFFEGGKLVYPPLAPPEPAPEFVEFLKKFEDFDIQPEKLVPHKPKWKKTEKLPDLPRKLPEIHSNNWLIEVKEVIKLRKLWLDLLQKGKFILKLLPDKFVLEVAKRIEHTRFPLLFSSTKWVNELIQNSASNFRIHGGHFRFSMDRIVYYGYSQSYLKKALKSLEFYYLSCIIFDLDFRCDDRRSYLKQIEYLKEVLQWVREQKIFVRRISVCNHCPLPIQDFLESFARGPESLLVFCRLSLYVPLLPVLIKFPPQLKEIEVNLEFFRRYEIQELIEGFTGIEQAVIWLCRNDKATNQTITHQLETLKSKKCRSNILIRSWKALDSIVNYDPQFDLSQISETVFIFRSMARGRGGVWNYFIRMESAGEGAVGIALYLDSRSGAESGAVGMAHFMKKDHFNRFNQEELNQSDIRCEYFPTMESFLDYFEREVGSKRRARDWMQLSEKHRTIEPREKDFKEFEIVMPYIHFNEQKEADDFEEVRRRFFS